MTCKTCKHAAMLERGLFCRRYPPTIVVGAANGAQTTAFPGTKDTWTCGEHRRWWQFWRR